MLRTEKELPMFRKSQMETFSPQRMAPKIDIHDPIEVMFRTDMQLAMFT
jgi:hypothetical protein